MSHCFYPLDKYKGRTWNDYILLMPVVSLGNVGQLAVDLLISTLDVELIGRFHHPVILPVVGSDPFQPESKILTTSCHVYVCESARMVIFQQRSPVASNGRKLYCELVIDWIKAQKFKKVVILSSACGIYLKDRDMEKKLQFLSTNADLEASFEEYGWTKVTSMEVSSPATNLEGVSCMPGSGLTRRLFQECCQKQIPTVVLVWHCSEGDNIPDAMELDNQLNLWLKLLPKTNSRKQLWKLPYSWNLLYGNGPPPSIF